MLGHQQVSECKAFNGPSLIRAFGVASLLVYRCWMHGAKFYVSPGPANTSIRLLMTRNSLPGLTSLVSICIGWMHVYGYVDNILNPWTLNVNRERFKLVESLWWYGAGEVGVIGGPDTSSDDSDKWRAHKHIVESSTQSMSIVRSDGLEKLQQYIPHVGCCYREAPRALFWLLTLSLAT